MNSMICENWDPFKKNEREALIKKMVLKRLGDEIRPISYQQFVFSMNLVVSGCDKNIIKTRLLTGEKRWKYRFWSKTLKLYRVHALAGFVWCKLEHFWASRRLSLLQTLCARRYEKRTQQAELVGKKAIKHRSWSPRTMLEWKISKICFEWWQ